MASCIEKLASYLQNDNKHITRSFYKNDEQFELVTRKGLCPYDYLNSWDKTKLPAKENFYSKLNNQHITDDDYLHAQHVWSTFELKSLGE